LRSLLRVDFPQSQPWNSETATQFSETVTVVAQSHEIRILNPAWLANFIVGSHITAFVDVQFIRHELREKIEPNRHHGLEKSVRILKMCSFQRYSLVLLKYARLSSVHEGEIYSLV
jgi:hypothetical protein